MKNWYCKPASEAEAIEIVRRAVANGYAVKEAASGMGVCGRELAWDVYSFWGVYDGKTMAHNAPDGVGEQLTIQQVREQFPLPNEVKVMSDKKEWRGPHANESPDFHKYGGTKYVAGFRPLRTEREKWIYDVCNLWHEHPDDSDDSFAEVIYDAIKSGSLKAPEAE